MNTMTSYPSRGARAGAAAVSDDAGGPLRSPPPRNPALQALARGLGFFSLALGLAALAAPRRVSQVAELGEMPDRPELPATQNVVRASGLRELGTGAGLLAADDPEPYVWGRVAGDVMDIATVALSPRRRTIFGRSGGSRTGTLLALMAVTAIDLYCAEGLRRERVARQSRTHDWSGRTGFPRGTEASRGAASDFVPPADMRVPELLRPWK